jgi:hypothetical protein
MACAVHRRAGEQGAGTQTGVPHRQQLLARQQKDELACVVSGAELMLCYERTAEHDKPLSLPYLKQNARDPKRLGAVAAAAGRSLRSPASQPTYMYPVLGCAASAEQFLSPPQSQASVRVLHAGERPFPISGACPVQACCVRCLQYATRNISCYF